MKLAGAFLFVLTTSWIGFDMSAALKKRSRELHTFIHSLQILEAEMGYGQLPLQVIFSSVADKTSAPVRGFYKFLADKLIHIVTDFNQVWDEGLDHFKKQSALKNQELDILRQFGRNLGHYTFHEQQKHITMTIHHLQTILNEANDERLKYEKMLRTLGVLIGLFI